MRLRVRSYRVTKKGNFAFQTEYGEFFLNPADLKCRKKFIRYFPDSGFMIERCLMLGGFRPEMVVGSYCEGYPVIEPIKESG